MPRPMRPDDPRPHAVLLDDRNRKRLARLPSYVQADYATLDAVAARGVMELKAILEEMDEAHPRRDDAVKALQHGQFILSWLDGNLDMTQTHDRGALSKDLKDILTSEQALKERRGAPKSVEVHHDAWKPEQ